MIKSLKKGVNPAALFMLWSFLIHLLIILPTVCVFSQEERKVSSGLTFLGSLFPANFSGEEKSAIYPEQGKFRDLEIPGIKENKYNPFLTLPHIKPKDKTSKSEKNFIKSIFDLTNIEQALEQKKSKQKIKQETDPFRYRPLRLE
ncbi:MAG: hypothetical protein HQL27_02200 [Candidatus Omnitrophica bacterium]|nr:hypothetical protein [Candidatus Omnitrophota bacterium]